MKKKVALVFGFTGGIGNAVKEKFVNNGYRIIPVNQKIIDFSSSKSDEQIDQLLTSAKPDVVINCTGYFANNSETGDRTMDINVNSNWSIIRHYIKSKDTPVKIIMLGSSACRGGRKDYIMYAASKAALLSMWEGARDAFEGTSVSIDLINPVRTRTKMVAPFSDDLDYLDPKVVAYEILQAAETTVSSCIDMTFKETK
jgi:short-subunit dehydrogenase